jgi:hypothetical protein
MKGTKKEKFSFSTFSKRQLRAKHITEKDI